MPHVKRIWCFTTLWLLATLWTVPGEAWIVVSPDRVSSRLADADANASRPKGYLAAVLALPHLSLLPPAELEKKVKKLVEAGVITISQTRILTELLPYFPHVAAAKRAMDRAGFIDKFSLLNPLFTVVPPL